MRREIYFVEFGCAVVCTTEPLTVRDNHGRVHVTDYSWTVTIAGGEKPVAMGLDPVETTAMFTAEGAAYQCAMDFARKRDAAGRGEP